MEWNVIGAGTEMSDIKRRGEERKGEKRIEWMKVEIRLANNRKN